MYVNVSIVLGCDELLKWTMYEADNQHTFTKLLEDAMAKPSCIADINSECKCYLSQDGKSNKVQVPLEFNVLQCCELNGKWVLFILSNDHGASSSINIPRSAFELLMASSRKLHLPKEMGSSTRGDIRLYNDIIHFMSNNSLGFHAGVEQTSGKLIVSTLQKVLFYIEPHLTTLNGRKANFLPTYFQPLLNTVYNNPTAHHHAVKPLEKSKLDDLSQILFECLSLSCLYPSKWQPFKSALEELSFNLVGYIDYLKSKNDRMIEVHLKRVFKSTILEK